MLPRVCSKEVFLLPVAAVVVSVEGLVQVLNYVNVANILLFVRCGSVFLFVSLQTDKNIKTENFFEFVSDKVFLFGKLLENFLDKVFPKGDNHCCLKSVTN